MQGLPSEAFGRGVGVTEDEIRRRFVQLKEAIGPKGPPARRSGLSLYSPKTRDVSTSERISENTKYAYTCAIIYSGESKQPDRAGQPNRYRRSNNGSVSSFSFLAKKAMHMLAMLRLLMLADGETG